MTLNIENEIFKRTKINYNNLIKYGFKKYNNNYIYENNILNEQFKVIIEIDSNGKVNGKIIDLLSDEEYLLYRTQSTGEFVGRIRVLYKNMLTDIRIKCCEKEYFIFNQTNRIAKYVLNKYNNEPEFLWDKFPGCAVFRNNESNKWYGIICNIDLSKIDKGTGEVEIINVKLDKEKIMNLLKRKGFYKAYHSNKEKWISILLDNTVPDKEIFDLIDESYNLVR